MEGRLILDPVNRVIRSPRRKIGRNERLVGPACMALDYGITPSYLALGIAALLCYASPDDPESTYLQAALRQHGLVHVLGNTAGVDLARYAALLDLVQGALRHLSPSEEAR